MSLWQKIIFNRVFAVAREIIYEHKFSVYTIFLTRLEHSNFNTCKIFVKFYDDFSNNDSKPTFVSLFLHILWEIRTKAKWNQLATCFRKCPLQYEPRCEKTCHRGF